MLGHVVTVHIMYVTYTCNKFQMRNKRTWFRPTFLDLVYCILIIVHGSPISLSIQVSGGQLRKAAAAKTSLCPLGCLVVPLIKNYL